MFFQINLNGMLHTDDNCATKVTLLLTITNLVSALTNTLPNFMCHLFNS
jgi:hypothetical protein